MVMKEDLYLEIIKKQQDLINLMLKTEIGTDIKETPAFETELKNNAAIEIEQSQNNDTKEKVCRRMALTVIYTQLKNFTKNTAF